MYDSILRIRLDEPIKAETLERLIDPGITDLEAYELLALELEELWVEIPYGSFIQLHRLSSDSAEGWWIVELHLQVAEDNTVVLPLAPDAIWCDSIHEHLSLFRQAFSLGRTFEREDR